MEEDNMAVSLCILIIIASAILRIRLDRRRRRARYCAHHSLTKELSSEDPELQQGTDNPLSAFSFADLGIFLHL